MRVFLSYSRDDSEFARKLAADLQSLGFETWSDLTDLQAGQYWAGEIRNAIAHADYVFCLISSHSALSEWMIKELETAERLSLRIVPVIVDEDAKRAILLRLADIQWLDLSDPKHYETALQTFAAQTIATSPEAPKPRAVSSESTTATLGEKFQGIDIETGSPNCGGSCHSH